MREKFLALAASLTLSATLILSGCKSSTPAPAPGAAPDQSSAAAPPTGAPASSASPTVAPGTAPAATPAMPGAATPAETAAGPVPPAPPPEPVKLTAPVGAAVEVTVTQELRASKNNVGDGFTGVLYQSVRTPSGAGRLPSRSTCGWNRGCRKGTGQVQGSGALGIQVTSISGTPVSVSSYEKEQKGKGKRTAGFIGGGAGGGALIGGLAGGGKGALIGGLIGAGAGTAGAAFTGNKDVVIPSESTISFHLTAPVTITVMPKDAAPPQ